jgi:hypothetical protein
LSGIAFPHQLLHRIRRSAARDNNLNNTKERTAMNMKKTRAELWHEFETSGSIEAYLRFKSRSDSPSDDSAERTDDA